MKLGTFGNPKFSKLARLLSGGRAAAAGHLEALWAFTSEQAPAGNVGRWDDEDIEEACFWEGSPGDLVRALVASGWLDRHSKHRLIVHDWGDHASDMIRKRNQRAGIEFVKADVPPEPEEPETESEGEPNDTASNGSHCPPDGSHAADTVVRTADHQTLPVQSSPVLTMGSADERRTHSGSEGAGREPPDPNDEFTLPEGYEDSSRVVSMLRLDARASPDERTLFAEAIWVEVVAAARIESAGGPLRDHVVKILNARWRTYLRERDPDRRQYAREAHLRALQAAKALVDAPPDESRPDPPDDDPLALMRSGGNPNVPAN